MTTNRATEKKNEREVHQHADAPFVLVVDDDHILTDALTANALAGVLRTNGFRATAVQSFESVILIALYRNFDYLIVGVIQHSNGMENARRFCRLNRDCRVLLISGQSNDTEMLEDPRSGCRKIEILPKHCDATEVIVKLHNMASASSPAADHRY